ncbi:kinase-like protein [Aaosphaeria arxii CBS 175.79]|uniref:non-specific serine/threonine protein kinase n=1 Tax=Aaosphaeria arxii CBS 175.79 TaxID=1450172 RepID=A0A6A5XJH4_9PLEO|nr:kinase-like protein [Aaosphaeria arxii CBS 175.79]KAF2012981.1 kinase-like protein [Aaosphaeria arxii CBS 175.79]
MSQNHLTNAFQSLSLQRPTPGITLLENQHIDLPPNSQLSLRFHGHLGHGGSASVDIVSDPTTGRTFARKLFKRYNGKDVASWSAAVHNEIAITKRMRSHPHMVQLFGTYSGSGGRELGMLLHPVADGGDLQEYLESIQDSRSGATGSQRAVLWSAFGCLADGLAFIHRSTIRHKDIKPKNILVHDGKVMYTDFGISLDATGLDRTTTSGVPQALTRRYCAPEVANYGRRNRKTDVFSLGCVFVEIMAVLYPGLGIGVANGGVPYWQMAEGIRKVLIGSRVSDARLGEVLRVIHAMLEPTNEGRIDSEDLLRRLQRIESLYPGSSPVLFCSHCSPNGPKGKATETVQGTRRRASPGNTATNSQAFQTNNRNLPSYRTSSPSPPSTSAAVARAIEKPLKSTEAHESYIYIFPSRREHGLVKIGTASNVPVRLKIWQGMCKHPISEYPQTASGQRIPTRYAERVEQLVRAELGDVRFQDERCDGCGQNVDHEWYRTTPEHAARVVRKFGDWLEGDPYQFDGTDGPWQLKDRARRRDMEVLCRPVPVKEY